jgi:hypothetical protein
VGLCFEINKRREKTKRKRKRGTKTVEEDPRLGPLQRNGCVPVWVVGRLVRQRKKETKVKKGKMRNV